MSSNQPLVWVLKDERPGTGNQAIGVAEALALDYEIKALKLSTLGRLPNQILGASLLAITTNSKSQILPPWPDLVISAGRRCASIARHIKRKSGGQSFICQIMYPGFAREIDLIVVPNHDQLVGSNIISITGAPNRITDEVLFKAKENWQIDFGKLPTPIVGIIVGGSSNRMPFGIEQAQELAQLVNDYNSKIGGSIIVTTSRRTGDVADSLLDKLGSLKNENFYFHRWGECTNNPYLAILSYSDILIVTGDSISMLSEACAAPGNVYIYTPKEFFSAKHLRFHQELYTMGAARPFNNKTNEWKSAQFNSANDLAKELKIRLGW